MPARLIADRINLISELESYRVSERPSGSDGALAVFLGSMRDFNAAAEVTAMTLEHYPEMTQRYLDDLCVRHISEQGLNDALIIHRYGDLEPGDDIVLVACWSTHRAEAFSACREMMEDLKRDAPFWKHETTTTGERWVHDVTDGEG